MFNENGLLNWVTRFVEGVWSRRRSHLKFKHGLVLGECIAQGVMSGFDAHFQLVLLRWVMGISACIFILTHQIMN